jgi:glycosyltransferase involved in cell wall biosynthesis
MVHSERLVGELAAAQPAARIAVIPHGAEVLARPYDRPQHPALLYFGRMEPYKGLPILLRSMERIWSVRPETRLSVHGLGPE